MPLDTKQQKWLPLGLNPQVCFQDIPTGSARPRIPSPELGSIYAAENQGCYMQPPLKTALLSTDHQSSGKQVSCLNGRSSYAAASQEPLKSFQKRFLIFDQSGTQTRLLQCGFPGQFPSAIAAEQGKTSDSHDPEKECDSPRKMFLHEDLVENQYDGKESELHEDTEEINALLYSDDDEEDDCESDDEVMSTGHSPFPIDQACNKTELDETDSSDGPRKRQKLLDHAYSDASSLVGTNCFTKLKELSAETLPESNISNKQETGSGLSDEQSKKDKIHTALSILESVVPGSKGKDALLLLDEAIDYLKLLKRNLNPSGVNNHW